MDWYGDDEEGDLDERMAQQIPELNGVGDVGDVGAVDQPIASDWIPQQLVPRRADPLTEEDLAELEAQEKREKWMGYAWKGGVALGLSWLLWNAWRDRR